MAEREKPKAQLMTVQDAAAVLGVGVLSVRRMITSGKLAYRKIGGRMMVPVGAVQDIVDGVVVEIPAPPARADTRIYTADRLGAPNIYCDRFGHWHQDCGGQWERTSIRKLKAQYGEAWPELR